MRNSKYLYGDLYDAPILKDMKYPEGLLQKIVWAKELLEFTKLYECKGL